MYRFKGSFVCAALCFATLLSPSLSATFAQSSFDQKIKDQELADSLKQKTNRTFDGLFEQVSPDGGVSVDLNGRFQNVMLARLGENGHPVVGCVASLNEANGFFGRDLETGARVSQPSWFADKDEDEAAAHGMSTNELSFYKKLIERYEEQIALSPSSATITIVNNDSAGEGFNDPTVVTPEGGNTATTRGQQRLNVFNAAAAIWGSFLDSQVRIQVSANFDPLECNSGGAVLGQAGTTTVHRNFTNAEFTNTWYHQALANKRSGSDLNATWPDISTTFNSSLNGNPNCLGGGRFYLGFDNSTPGGTTNLLVVVLHELAHGLGFSDFAGNDGTFFNGFTDIYITNLFDRTTNKMWNAMTDAERAASMINNNNVLWDGGSVKFGSSGLTNGRDANGRVEVFTPNPLQGGSSVSHWNQRASPNLLMEPAINLGLPLTLDLTRQQMRDVGWFRDSNGDGTPDTITGITPSGNQVLAGSQATITWANNGGFNRNVTIELSTDGGTTFPITVAANIANTGTRSFTVPAILTNQARIRVRETDYASPAGTSSANFTITNTLPTVKAPFDFDGDGKTEVSIYRPGTAEWWYRRSSDGNVSAAQFGGSAFLVPGDFSGDGKADIAFWFQLTGEWFILRSEDGSFYSFPFGTTNDIPVPADYDGDGVTDAAVFRPSTNTWFILQSTGGTAFINFGSNGDRPTPADYDGDGKTDIGIFRPASGEWWYLRSTDSTVRAVNFGLSTDRAVPGDFSGDGKADQAFFRPSTGEWFVLRSQDASFYSFPFGTTGDIPTPGDFDGDGTMDAAVFRPSSANWFINASTSGVSILQFGNNSDVPVPNVYVR